MVGLAREAYPILKRADPNNVVLSPNFAGALGLAYLDRYLAAGGGAYADAIAVHYYPRNYGMERYKNLIRNLREVLSQYGLDNLPIWNTEFGFCDGPSSTLLRFILLSEKPLYSYHGDTVIRRRP